MRLGFIAGLAVAAIIGGYIAFNESEKVREAVQEKTEQAKKQGVNMLKVAVQFAVEHVTEIAACTTFFGAIEAAWTLKKAMLDKPEEQIIKRLDYISSEMKLIEQKLPTDYTKCYAGGES